MIFSLVLPLTAFAQGGSLNFETSASNSAGALGNSGLVRILNEIMAFFTGGIMRAICFIALGGLGIGVLMNRGEPGMVKKFIPWIVGVSILLSLNIIVKLFWEGT